MLKNFILILFTLFLSPPNTHLSLLVWFSLALSLLLSHSHVDLTTLTAMSRSRAVHHAMPPILHLVRDFILLFFSGGFFFDVAMGFIVVVAFFFFVVVAGGFLFCGCGLIFLTWIDDRMPKKLNTKITIFSNKQQLLMVGASGEVQVYLEGLEVQVQVVFFSIFYFIFI